MAAAAPTRIHRYRILSELGRGSMGRVFLAEDPNTDRKIALKVLDPRRPVDDAAADRLRERFLLEARAAGRLQHPGVVMVLDADTDPSTQAPYIAMEWVDGESLQQILAREGPLPVAVAVGMALRVAEALAFAHDHDVVHRDVKPGNILVSRSGSIKLSDFGIAKLTSQSLTGTGTVLGSPFYMAPEQVRGEEVDARSDLFSLGAVLYEALAGRPPFVGETMAATTYKILEVDPRPVDLSRPEAGEGLARLVERALAKRPEERFQSGTQLAAALRHCLQEPREDSPAAPTPDAPAPATDDPDLPPRPRRVYARKYMTGIGSETLSTETRIHRRGRRRRRRRLAALLGAVLALATLAILFLL